MKARNRLDVTAARAPGTARSSLLETISILDAVTSECIGGNVGIVIENARNGYIEVSILSQFRLSILVISFLRHSSVLDVVLLR